MYLINKMKKKLRYLFFVNDFGNEWDKFKKENISRDSWDQYFHLYSIRRIKC